MSPDICHHSAPLVQRVEGLSCSVLRVAPRKVAERATDGHPAAGVSHQTGAKKDPRTQLAGSPIGRRQS